MGESRVAILAAFIGNLAIAVVKLIAAYITSSSAMLSEGIHSIVDTGNQGLLLLGIQRSKKPPDIEHPYGHGREIYFWSFVVAVAIFAVGGGVSVYEGIRHLINPTRIENPNWNYFVLGFAAVFEGISWFFGWRVFRKKLKDQGPVQAVRRSKDPTMFIVVFEDTAALIGLAIAFLGVYFGHLLERPYLDGLASILIGLMLGLISVFLGYETKGLLIGEGYDRETIRDLRKIIVSDQAIKYVNHLLTQFLGPEDVMLTVEVRFRDHLTTEQIGSAIDRIKKSLKSEHPEIQRIYFAAEHDSEQSASELLSHNAAIKE